MVLFAIAVVCILLGSLALSKDDSGDPLEKAAQSAQSSASEAPASSSSSTAPKPTPTTSDVSDVPRVCVLNVGRISGLAKEVANELKAKGFKIGTVANYQTQSIDENTIFFMTGQEEAAKKLAADVPGGASPSPRPDVFTRCPGDLVLLVTSR